jgi:hypothetical protein
MLEMPPSRSLLKKNLDRDRTIEPRVAGFVHLSDNTRADAGRDLVRTKLSAGREGNSLLNRFSQRITFPPLIAARYLQRN